MLFSLNLLLATQETYVNTDRVIPNMKLLHRVVDPLEILPIKRNHIYRKNKSLDTNEWFILSYKDNDLKWEYLCSIHENSFLPYGSLIENINSLSYTTEESILENGAKYSYLMI